MFANLSVADCQFLQEVTENQGWILDQAVPKNLLCNSTH